MKTDEIITSMNEVYCKKIGFHLKILFSSMFFDEKANQGVFEGK